MGTINGSMIQSAILACIDANYVRTERTIAQDVWDKTMGIKTAQLDSYIFTQILAVCACKCVHYPLILEPISAGMGVSKVWSATNAPAHVPTVTSISSEMPILF